MGEKTGIEWTDSTWTPIRAKRTAVTGDRRTTTFVGWHCEHVSEACRNCYAETLNRRLGTGLDFKPGHRKDIEIFLDEAMLTKPLHWRKPRKIFVCSMTDLFADFVKDEWIDQMFAVMALCPQHMFQVLTKRPERMRAYFETRKCGDPWAEAADAISDLLGMEDGHAKVLEPRDMPLPNVWLGTSCEDQATADERIPHLLCTPAAIRFLSCEPMLGPIDLGLGTIRDEYADAKGPVDWVICGGESGPNARPMHPDWARSLRDQCAEAGVAFHFKQWGEWRAPAAFEDADRSHMIGPNDFRRIGKKRAGRLLDRVEHNQFPEPRT